MKIRLGLARSGDVPALAAMTGALVEDGLPQTWDEARIHRCHLHRDYVVLVARDGKRIAGFAVMEYLDEHAHLCLLAVRPAYQKRGIGRALVEWLEATARTAGTFAIRLEVRAGNLAARRFYARVGYVEAGTRRAYYAGREDAITLTRSLVVAQPHPS